MHPQHSAIWFLHPGGKEAQFQWPKTSLSSGSEINALVTCKALTPPRQQVYLPNQQYGQRLLAEITALLAANVALLGLFPTQHIFPPPRDCFWADSTETHTEYYVRKVYKQNAKPLPGPAQKEKCTGIFKA